MKFLGIIPARYASIGYAGGEDGDTACIRTSSGHLG